MKTLQIGVLKINIYYMIPRIRIMCRSLCYIFPLLALSDTDWRHLYWEQKKVERKVNKYRWNILGSENSPKNRKSVLRINNTVLQNILQNCLFGVFFFFLSSFLWKIYFFTRIQITCLEQIFLISQYCRHHAVILKRKYCYIFS